jgi:hypothetical protein
MPALPEGFEVVDQTPSTGLPEGFELAPSEPVGGLPSGFEVVSQDAPQIIESQPIQQEFTQQEPLIQEPVQPQEFTPLGNELDQGRNIPFDLETQAKSDFFLSDNRYKMRKLRNKMKLKLKSDTAQQVVVNRYKNDFPDLDYKNLPDGMTLIDVSGSPETVASYESRRDKDDLPRGMIKNTTVQDAVIPMDAEAKFRWTKKLEKKYKARTSDFESSQFQIERKFNLIQQTVADLDYKVEQEGADSLTAGEVLDYVAAKQKQQELSNQGKQARKNYLNDTKDLQIVRQRPTDESTYAEIAGRFLVNAKEGWGQTKLGLKASQLNYYEKEIDQYQKSGLDEKTAQQLTVVESMYSANPLQSTPETFDPKNKIDGYIRDYKNGTIDEKELNFIVDGMLNVYRELELTKPENEKWKMTYNETSKQLLSEHLNDLGEQSKALEEKKGKYSTGDDPLKWLFARTGESLVHMTPAIVASAITRNPKIGASAFFTLEFGSEYAQHMVDPNLTPDQKLKISFSKALVSGILEKIPLGAMLKQSDNFLGKMTKTAGAESITESITEGFHIGLEQGILDKNTPLDQAIKRIVQAGIVGGTSGAVMSAAVPGADTEAQKIEQEINKNIESFQFEDTQLPDGFDLVREQDDTAITDEEIADLPEMTTEPTGVFDIDQTNLPTEVEPTALEIPEGFEVVEPVETKAGQPEVEAAGKEIETEKPVASEIVEPKTELEKQAKSMPEKVSAGSVVFTPKAINNKELYRETSIEGVTGLLRETLSNNSDKGAVTSIFVTDDKDLALGQDKNKGVQIVFDGSLVSGEINKKPSTGIIGGNEFKTDYINKDAIKEFTLPKGVALKGLVRTFANQQFNKTINEDGSTTFTRKDLAEKQEVKISTKVDPVLASKRPSDLPLKTFYHGGTLDVPGRQSEGLLFVAEDIKQAEAYAEGNEGVVKEFQIDEPSILDEDAALEIMDGLDIKPLDDSWDLDEASIYELLDPEFEQFIGKENVIKLKNKLKEMGKTAISFFDQDITPTGSGKQTAKNLVILNDEILTSETGAKQEVPENVSPLHQEFIEAKSPKPKGVLKSTRTEESASDGVLYSRTFTPKQKIEMEPASKEHLPLQEDNALNAVQNKTKDGPMINNPPSYYKREKAGEMPARKEFFLLRGKKIKSSSEQNPQRREGIIMHTKSIIGKRLYYNRIKGKDIAGFYNTVNGELRLDKYGDVETLAHEMAHFLDFYYKGGRQIKEIYSKPEYEAEIKLFSYTSDEKLLLTEGFAEYVRAWLTNYDYAVEKAPKFTRAFEHYLNKNKSLKNKLYGLQVKMHRWYFQGDKARLVEGISGETKLNKSLTMREKVMRLNQAEIGAEFKQGVFDYLHAAKVMSREVKGGLTEGVSEPYKLLQLLHGADQIFAESYKRGAPYYKKDGSLDFKGMSLDKVWGQSKKEGHNRIKDQEAYFASRRAEEATKKGTEKLFTKGMIREGLALGEKFPYFKKAFADFQIFNKAMLQFYVDSGYISQSSMNAFLKNNTAYVAFHRAIHGLDKDGAGAGSNIGARQSGSEESVLHIYNNTLKQTGIHIAAALKARAMRGLYEQTLAGGGKDVKQGGSQFITEATTDVKPITIDADQIAKTILQTGTKNALKVSDLEFEHNGQPVKTMVELIIYLNSNPDLLKFWTFGHPPKDKRTDFDSYIDENGDTKWIQINEDNTLLPSMIDSLNGMNLPKNPYVKALAKLPLIYKNFKTLGITSAWQFAGGNIFRDSATAMALSGFKFKPVISHIRGLAHMTESLWNKNGLVGELRGNGGYSGGRMQSAMYDSWGLAGSNTQYLSNKAWYKSPLRIAKELVFAYTKVADVTEMMTRVGFYAEQRKAGVDPVEAAWQTRQITTDFQKHGSNPQLAYAVRTSAFLNAGMMGFMREMEAIFEVNGEMKLSNWYKDEKGILTIESVKARMYGVMMMLSGLAMMSAYLMVNSDDEEDRETYRNLTPDERSRFIYLPGGTKLPKPIGVFGFSMAMSEIGINQHLNPDEDKEFLKDDVLFALGYHMVLSGSPSILQLPLDFISGEDWKGSPIVPANLTDVKAFQQYNSRTSMGLVELSQNLKSKFGINLSPIKTEYVIKNSIGYYSEYMKEYTDRLFWDYEAWGERPFQKSFADISFRQFKVSERTFRTKYTTAYYKLYGEAIEASKSSTTDLQQIIEGTKRGGIAASKEELTLSVLAAPMREINKAYKEWSLGIIISDRDPKLTAAEKEKKHIERLTSRNKTFEDSLKQFKSILEKVKNEESKIN